MNKGVNKIILTLLVLVGIFILGYFLRNLFWNKIVNQPQIKTVVLDLTSRIPFYSMTIPALRSREYKSILGNLEKYSKDSNFTTYITSYDSDGLKINGLLTIPDGKEPEGGWPAVVFVHGYIAPTIYKTTEKYTDYVNYLSRNGFVVFKIDLRGHGESEGEPAGGYYSEGYVIDALNAYNALQNADFINSQKIGLWGHSMAGNVVLRAFAAKPDIPAVVIWAGAGYTYSDLLEYGLNDNSYRPPTDNTERARRRQALRDAHGDFSPSDEFWKLVAPTNYLNDLKGAIQIHHAINDDVVSIEYSRNLNSLLNNSNVAHELFEYSSGGHNISGTSFSTAMRRTVEFYKKYLTD